MKHKRRATAEYIASRFEEETVIVENTTDAVMYAADLAKKSDAKGQKAAVVVCGSLNLLEEILCDIKLPLNI